MLYYIQPFTGHLPTYLKSLLKLTSDTHSLQTTYLLTYLLTYLPTYLLTYIRYLLHHAQSFFFFFFLGGGHLWGNVALIVFYWEIQAHFRQNKSHIPHSIRTHPKTFMSSTVKKRKINEENRKDWRNYRMAVWTRRDWAKCRTHGTCVVLIPSTLKCLASKYQSHFEKKQTTRV